MKRYAFLLSSFFFGLSASAGCGRREEAVTSNLPPTPAAAPAQERRVEFVFAPARHFTAEHARKAGFPEGTTVHLRDSGTRSAAYAVADGDGDVFVYLHDTPEQAREQFTAQTQDRRAEIGKRGAFAAAEASYVARLEERTRYETAQWTVEVGRASGRLSVTVRLRSHAKEPAELDVLEQRARALAELLAP